MFTECTVISTLGLSLSGTALHSLKSVGEGLRLTTEEKTSDSFKIEDRKSETSAGGGRRGRTGNTKNKSGTMVYTIDG
jgi:hypothetical protein